MRNVSDRSCRGNQNTRFVFNNFFPENLAVYEVMWKKYGRGRQTTDDNIIELSHYRPEQAHRVPGG
jgi:hypothetical protein